MIKRMKKVADPENWRPGSWRVSAEKARRLLRRDERRAVAQILFHRLLMKPGSESFFIHALLQDPIAGPWRRPLIVPGLCGGEVNPYNGSSDFVTSY